MAEVKDKFEDRHLVRTVTLPSRGRLYVGTKLFENGGEVRIAGFTTREEMLFSGAGESGYARLNTAVSACADLLDLDPLDLLSGDFLFLLFNIRALSYEQGYGLHVSCGKCGKGFDHRINLPGDLELREAPDDYAEPFLVELPLTKRILELRTFRRRDEITLERQVDALVKRRDPATEGLAKGDPGFIPRIALHIVTVDGVVPSSFGAAMQTVQSLEGRDSLAVRRAMDANVYGYQLGIDAKCPYCGFNNEEDVSMNDEFFRPESS